MADFFVSVVVPVRIESEANRHEHWRKAWARKQLHRKFAAICLAHIKDRPPAGARVLINMRRIAPRLLDDDNLVSGFKALRDGVADWLGIDDGSPLLTWQCEQSKGAPKTYAAHVVVSWPIGG